LKNNDVLLILDSIIIHRIILCCYLLSTSKQHPEAAGAAAARFTEHHLQPQQQIDVGDQALQQHRIEAFQRELKGLKVLPEISPENNKHITTTETDMATNYAAGLNAALSAGLQFLSRYRLHNSQTEHFGMGRIPNCAVVTSIGSPATAALQPASLILVSDQILS
jgi:hypothetical protein